MSSSEQTSLQELSASLNQQGLFHIINQGGANRDGRYVITYKAIVLDEDQVRAVKAAKDPLAEQLRWRDVEDHPDVYEGSDPEDALKGALRLYFEVGDS